MMKHSISISVALMAVFALATPALGMRPLGRALHQTDEAPAPEEEALIIDFGPEYYAPSPEEELGLGRGYGDNWRDNDRRNNDYNYNYNDRRNNDYNYNYNNRRDYNDNDRRTVIIVGTPVTAAGKTLTIDPWKLGQTYPDQTASVGDTITFKWAGTHGVYKIPSGTCPTDFNPTSENGISVIQAPIADGTAQYKFDSAGTYWFACPVGNGAHCDGGMKVKIVVS